MSLRVDICSKNTRALTVEEHSKCAGCIVNIQVHRLFVEFPARKKKNPKGVFYMCKVNYTIVVVTKLNHRTPKLNHRTPSLAFSTCLQQAPILEKFVR